MKDQIANKIKKQRVNRLSALSNQLYHDFMGSFINKEIDVVLEETKDGMLFGHSSEYLPIYIQQEHMPASKRMRACVRDYYRDGLIAVEMEEAA